VCSLAENPDKIKKLGKFVTSQITAVQGDPGHLNHAKRKVQSTILSDGCPTHWSTYAFNDTNLTDLHNHNIMPYSIQRARHPNQSCTKKSHTLRHHKDNAPCVTCEQEPES
jgi:hypothetical protein